MALFKQFEVDYVVGETFDFVGEALLALEVIGEFGVEFGLPSAITMSTTFSPAASMRILSERSANVVGLNCSRGPDTMLPLLRDIRQSLGDAEGLKLAALPVCYRTNGEYSTMQAFGEMDEKYLILD